VSFLSSEQRQAALKQIERADALLMGDLTELAESMSRVMELRRCLKHNASRIIMADDGECPIDEIQEADDFARDMMSRGITHYPVVVSAGEKRVVKA